MIVCFITFLFFYTKKLFQVQKYFKNGADMPYIANSVGTFRNKIRVNRRVFTIFVRKRILMDEKNPLITTSEDQFIVGYSDFSYFEPHAYRL